MPLRAPTSGTAATADTQPTLSATILLPNTKGADSPNRVHHVQQRLTAPGQGSPPLLMGIVNTTPDSFSDGGRYLDAAAGMKRVDDLLRQGVDIIDIGAESSRPGSPEVPADEQLRRLGPTLDHALAQGAFVSIDTTSPRVAARCLERGAQMINDVSFLRQEALAHVTSAHDAYLVLNHSRAPMSEMGGFSQWPDDDYADIVEDLKLDWGQTKDRAMRAGMTAERLVFDPGFGFSKNARHCFALLARLGEFRDLQVPMLVGPGRKSFVGSVDDSGPGERIGGTIAACLLSAQAGADVLRVHDVREVRQALLVWERTRDEQGRLTAGGERDG